MVLYGCETWSLTLREERRLRVFENSVLRGEFAPKRDEVTEECCTLHVVGYLRRCTKMMHGHTNTKNNLFNVNSVVYF